MRQQGRNCHGGENAARDAAEDKLTQSRMPVAAHHHEIHPRVRRVGQNDICCIDIVRDDSLDFDVGSVTREMLRYTGARNLITLDLIADDHNFNGLRPLEEWQRVAHGTRRVVAAIPADQGTFEAWRIRLDIRHDHHRTAGIEQR